MALEYDDVDGPALLSSILSGGAQEWFLFRKDDLETESTPEDIGPSATNRAAIVKISVPHVFKTGKRMYRMYSTENTAKLKISKVGSKDSYGFKLEAEWFVPGLDADVLGMGVMAQNDKVFGIFKLMNGKQIQVGCTISSGILTFDFDSGEVEQGGLGMTFKLSAYDKTVRIYEPAPQLTPEA